MKCAHTHAHTHSEVSMLRYNNTERAGETQNKQHQSLLSVILTGSVENRVERAGGAVSLPAAAAHEKTKEGQKVRIKTGRREAKKKGAR